MFEQENMHEKHSTFEILSETRNGYLGVCTCCLEFNFAYKNLVLTFNEKDMFSILNWLVENENNPANVVNMHHGKERVYASPVKNIFLAFNIDELKEIDVLITEAQILWEAKGLAGQR